MYYKNRSIQRNRQNLHDNFSSMHIPHKTYQYFLDFATIITDCQYRLPLISSKSMILSFVWKQLQQSGHLRVLLANTEDFYKKMYSNHFPRENSSLYWKRFLFGEYTKNIDFTNLFHSSTEQSSLHTMCNSFSK